MSAAEQPDPRAKYTHLPATARRDELVESVDTDRADTVPDGDDGATPYLRMTLGPWVR